MALTTVCRARLQDPELDAYDKSIQAAVRTLQQWTASQELYAAWPKEVVVANPTEVDPQHRRPRSGALEDKELEAYVTIFTALLEAERDAEMDEEALEARVGAGHNGFRIKVGDHVILSRVHPYQYAFKHPLLVCEGEGGELKQDATKHAPEYRHIKREQLLRDAGMPPADRSTRPLSFGATRG